jgi:hypothetical protein
MYTYNRGVQKFMGALINRTTKLCKVTPNIRWSSLCSLLRVSLLAPRFSYGSSIFGKFALRYTY